LAVGVKHQRLQLRGQRRRRGRAQRVTAIAAAQAAPLRVPLAPLKLMVMLTLSPLTSATVTPLNGLRVALSLTAPAAAPVMVGALLWCW
jgi:hypothetical protein